MATISSGLPKRSFANIAASVATENPSAPSTSRSTMQSKDHLAADILSPTGESTESPPPAISLPQSVNPIPTDIPGAMEKVVESLDDLRLGSNVPSLVVDGSNSSAVARSQAVFSRASGSDDSQKADSSSELGTKPPSLDGKSITSGTTFALDEKESLRPDDSASVKAAAEDDDSFSIRGSLIAGSRMSSDFAARARGIQLGDMPDRRLAQPVAGTHGIGILTPQSTSSEQPAQNPLRSAGGSSDALNVIYRQAPDDKLLEALAAPRDRLFLLRLEKDVIDFVQDSKQVSPFSHFENLS
ncbi:hypothetical protein THARTR1_05990 [Trichoderma harzianum]|uniref:R3H domain-containing protein n=1 Tax=Trichoderma harzianum TaxID=5544 RepID=A0A2K0U684_TRIHA|nr:hypothetical protein THARTR1_05990 [Trichoderma harzianum]